MIKFKKDRTVRGSKGFRIPEDAALAFPEKTECAKAYWEEPRTTNPEGGNNIKGRKLWRREPSFAGTVDPLIPLEQSLHVGALRLEGWVDQMPVNLKSQAKTHKFHSVKNDQPPTFFDRERELTKSEFL